MDIKQTIERELREWAKVQAQLMHYTITWTKGNKTDETDDKGNRESDT